MHPYRTRFAKEIVAEFLPPLTRKKSKGDRVIIFCPGQPGMPGGLTKLEYWAKRGYWAFSIRYRGSWESGGKFLRKSPEQDVLDLVHELVKKKRVVELFGHTSFAVHPKQMFLFGISFGGPAALLASHDPRVTKVVCFSPVVDWKDHLKRGETIDWNYRFTHEAFGDAYRFSKKDWDKLKNGIFYNPMAHVKQINGSKVLIIHAKDDNIVRTGPVAKFARVTGAKLMMLKRGGHVPSDWFTKPRFYKRIAEFLQTK